MPDRQEIGADQEKESLDSGYIQQQIFQGGKEMAPKRKRIQFSILAPEAEQVLLSGTFNRWSDSSDPMKMDDAGVWKRSKCFFKVSMSTNSLSTVNGRSIPDAVTPSPINMGRLTM